MEELKPRSGHTYSKACKQLMILILLTILVGHLEADLSVDPTHIRGSVEEAAKICHCSYTHMRHQWNLFEEHGHVQSPKKRGRKRIEPSICYEGENLSCEHIVHIQESIQEFNQETGEGVTLKKLRCSLQKEFNISVRNALLRKVLLRLGFKWLKCEKKGKLKHCASKKLRTRQFLIEYSAALKQQNHDKTHILVYMDESYAHQRHSANYTWPLLPIRWFIAEAAKDTD